MALADAGTEGIDPEEVVVGLVAETVPVPFDLGGQGQAEEEAEAEEAAQIHRVLLTQDLRPDSIGRRLFLAILISLRLL